MFQYNFNDLQVILDSIPAWVFYKDKENRFLKVNRAFCKAMGKTKEEVEGKSAFDIYPKEQAEYFWKDDLEVIKSAKPKVNIIEQVDLADRKAWLKTDKIPYKDDNGNIIGVIGFALDITEERQARIDLENANLAVYNVLQDLQSDQRVLAETKVKEDALLASIGDGIIAIDLYGKIIVINKAAEKLLGLKAEEAIGQVYVNVISLENEMGTRLSFDERPMTKVVIRPTTTTTKLYLVNKNNIKIPVAITVSPVILDNKVIGAVEVFRDITRENEIDKAKTEFVSLASHQLRTPLTAISWYTEMVLNGDVGQIAPKQREYLEIVREGNRRMVALVNNLLNVSRIETGKFKMMPEPTNIVALAQSVLDEQKPKIEEKKLIVKTDFAKEIPTLLTDPKFLRMVFQNLLSNSVNYTPPNGKIQFSISLSNNQTLVIRVADTGYGIPLSQQDKIFTKLFRSDNVRNKEINGTGLGLYIVKSIVESSGGKIWFESPSKSPLGGESPQNPGTCFYVTFPLDKMKPPSNAPQVQAIPQNNAIESAG